MKNLFGHLLRAEQKSKEYINLPEGDEKADGIAKEALESYDNIDQYLVDVLEALASLKIDGTKKKVSGAKGERELKENNEKITPELLDKLIKEVILNK